jgi:hypothetical protein
MFTSTLSTSASNLSSPMTHQHPSADPLLIPPGSTQPGPSGASFSPSGCPGAGGIACSNLETFERQFIRVLNKVYTTIEKNEVRLLEQDRRDTIKLEWQQVALVIDRYQTCQHSTSYCLRLIDGYCTDYRYRIVSINVIFKTRLNIKLIEDFTT